jgi:hypothetical protein
MQADCAFVGHVGIAPDSSNGTSLDPLGQEFRSRSLSVCVTVACMFSCIS